ncbi:MAG: hypothetical protein NT075_07285 [Chloroflexi bacterium]|nr:hypothetical protein [Chloroflexota bacterium]
MYNITARDRSIAFLLFGFLFACYLFTYTGVIDSSDGLSMFSTAESMVRRGQIDSNQLLWMGSQQGNLGPDGDLYSRKGLGMTLLALPLLWLAQRWPAIGLVQAAMLLNPLLTAWTGALLYRCGRRLGWSQNSALATALIFGLATLAWPYAQTFFSDPVCGWALFAAFYGLLSYGQTGRKLYLAAGSLAWSLAYLTRTVNLITLPIFVIALLIVLRHRTQTQPPDKVASLANYRLLIVRNWRPIISFFLPVIAAGLLSLWWNWLRYGNIWDSGYVASESFSANWLMGISGLTLGPARGLIWYSPALLLGIFGVSWFWKQARWVLGVALSISLIYVLLYGKWYMWHGGYSWGPRFLAPVLPFLALFVGPTWEQLVIRHQAKWPGRLFAIFLVVLSILVQWLGMLIPYTLVQDWLATVVQPLFAPITFLRLGYSPLFLQWKFLQPENFQLAWWRAGNFDWLGFAMPLVGLLVGLGLLVQQTGAKQPLAISANTRSWLYALVLGIITVGMLTHVQITLSDTNNRTTALRIEQMERAGDAILLLQPFQTQQFANVYHGKLPTYGLFPRTSLDAQEAKWLVRLEEQYPRLWVIPDYTPPEQSGWERPLRVRDFLLQENRLSDVGAPITDTNRLALYALADAQAQPLVETGLGTIFGDPAAHAPTIDEANGWIRLKGYSVTVETERGGEILLSLRWQSLRHVSYNYHVFVHLLDAQGNKIEQRDGQPVQWMRPISTWQPGDEIVDHYGLLVPEDLPAGDYTIAVGLYDPNSGQRLPVSAGPKDFAIELGAIMVKAKP